MDPPGANGARAPGSRTPRTPRADDTNGITNPPRTTPPGNTEGGGHNSPRVGTTASSSPFSSPTTAPTPREERAARRATVTATPPRIMNHNPPRGRIIRRSPDARRRLEADLLTRRHQGPSASTPRPRQVTWWDEPAREPARDPLARPTNILRNEARPTAANDDDPLAALKEAWTQAMCGDDNDDVVASENFQGSDSCRRLTAFQWAVIKKIPQRCHFAWCECLHIALAWIDDASRRHSSREAFASMMLLHAIPALIARADNGGSTSSITKRLTKSISNFKQGNWVEMLQKAFERGALEQHKARSKTRRQNEDATNASQLNRIINNTNEQDLTLEREHRRAQESVTNAAMRKEHAAAKRAASLMTDGLFTMANRAINPTPRAPGDSNTEAKLQALNPPPSEPHDITRQLDGPDGGWRRKAAAWALEVRFDDAHILAGIKNAKRQTSPDRWGWRPEFWLPALNSETVPGVLEPLVRRLLRGHTLQAINTAMAGSRLSALSKPHRVGSTAHAGIDIRPVAVTDILRKLAARVLKDANMNHINDFMISADGRVLQLGCGINHGVQKCAIAVSEHRRLHPTDAIFSLDATNAFNRVSRVAVARGIERLGADSGRSMLPFFLSMYGKPAVLSYFHDDNTKHDIVSTTGVAQGDVLGSILYCLATHPIITDALNHLDVKDIHSYSIADDTNLVGPLDQAILAAKRVQDDLHNKADLEIKEWNVLLGPQCREVTVEQLRAQGLTGKIRIIKPDAANRGAHGLDVGVNGGGESCGARIVGAPVGDTMYARDFVRQVCAQHAVQLDAISKFGSKLGYAHEAMLLLKMCAAPRLVFLLSLVPYDLAGDEYDKAHTEIINTFTNITNTRAALDSIDNARTHAETKVGKITRDRISLPARHGGFGLTKPKDIADNALISTWLACAPWLASKVPALKDIALRTSPRPDEPTGHQTREARQRQADAQRAAASIPNHDRPLENGPLHGFAEQAFERVCERGEEEKKLICPAAGSFTSSTAAFTGKNVKIIQLQNKLTNEVHKRTVAKCITDANDPIGTNYGIDRTDIATHMMSLNGPHTMAWASTAPVAPTFRLRADILSHLVHYLLNLPHPDFINLKQGGYKTHCCGASNVHLVTNPTHIYSHILRTRCGNNGGSRTRTHNRTYAVLAKHAASAGHAVYLEQRGIMPAHLTRENGKIPDFVVQREDGTTEAVDFTTATVLEHAHGPLLRDEKPKPVSVGCARNNTLEHANRRAGVGIKIAEKRKETQYPRELPPLCKLTILAVETTGRFSKATLEWCKDVAKQQQQRQHPAHLPAETATNEQGSYNPEAIKKYHYNVAEAQLQLHRQNMEWCIGTIAKARNQHVDDEPAPVLDLRPDIIHA